MARNELERFEGLQIKHGLDTIYERLDQHALEFNIEFTMTSEGRARIRLRNGVGVGIRVYRETLGPAGEYVGTYTVAEVDGLNQTKGTPEGVAEFLYRLGAIASPQAFDAERAADLLERRAEQ